MTGEERGVSAGLPVEKRMKADDMVEYDELVSKLADRLKLACHPDTAVTIKAAHFLIERLLSKEKEEKQAKASDKCDVGAQQGEETRIQRSKFSLADVTLPRRRSIRSEEDDDRAKAKEEDKGKDEKLDDWLLPARRTLKLLYLDDQKQLQFRVNEIISSIQAVTANPKTDARLLTTGR